MKFNGINLRTVYGFMLDFKLLPMPRVRRSTSTRPGVDGVIDFGGTFEERDITIRGSMVDSTNHDDLITDIRALASAIGAVPMGLTMAPLMGQPISATSVNGTLEFEDFPNIVFHVLWNGTFEVSYLGRSGGAEKAVITMGFRQVNPWASSNFSFSFEGTTSVDGHFYVENENGLYVSPLVVITGQDADVDGADLINMGVDPLNTTSITGTVLGAPVFNSVHDNILVINGSFNFATGDDAVTFPIANAFSQEQGTVEMLYIPTVVPSSVTTVLWCLYYDATNFWKCWYDDSDNRFKFTMKWGIDEVEIDSGLGIIAANALHRITVSWDSGFAYISRNASTRVSGVKLKIPYPTSIRVGSFGDDTLPAKGLIDEFIVWNRDVGASYDAAAWASRRNVPFGRPVPGVLMYAGFDFSPNAVGCGRKIFTYADTIGILDRVLVDMEKRTVTFWNDGSLTFQNAIANMDNGFFDVMPGMNTMKIAKTGGAGNVIVEVNFVKRYLI